MPWIISLFVAVVVCGVIFFVGRVTRNESGAGTPGALRGLLLMVGAGALFVLWIGVSTVASSVRQVEAGHVGVVYQFGEIVGQKSEGLQFIANNLVIIYFAIVDNDISAAGGLHGLMALRRKINDRQTPVTERYPCLRIDPIP